MKNKIPKQYTEEYLKSKGWKDAQHKKIQEGFQQVIDNLSKPDMLNNKLPHEAKVLNDASEVEKILNQGTIPMKVTVPKKKININKFIKLAEKVREGKLENTKCNCEDNPIEYEKTARAFAEAMEPKQSWSEELLRTDWMKTLMNFNDGEEYKQEVLQFIEQQLQIAKKDEREKIYDMIEQRFYGANDPKVSDILETLKD